ncbi:GcrA family cell cycle regulator [Rhizobium favelukesii]|uniref:GcrA family cell cycle regulator n=1 Tax=Rhizobium favelukesii TaxID=348824 RepID=UPI00055D8B97|nr:GcrA family cell cycle regulator [Rhizobium favelukesii]
MNMRPEFDIDTASKMWNDGFSAGMIANALGVSRNVVIGKANRNRELFPNKAKTGIRGGHRVGIPRAELTEEERERRRNAQNAKRRTERGFTRRTKAESVEQRREEREDKAAQRRQRGFTASIDILRQPTAKPLYDLRACDCHWPCSDGPAYLFCAAETTEGSAYCAEHLERSLPSLAERRVTA